MKTLAVVLSAAALFSAAAFAGNAPAVQQKTVVYGDLNLGTPEGVTALHQRIVAAATEVCTFDADKNDNVCQTKAEKSAYEEVGRRVALRLSSAR
jgi:UrcA family protein